MQISRMKLMGSLVCAAGLLTLAPACAKRQQTHGQTARERATSQQVAGERTDYDNPDAKPERLIQDANSVLESINDPVRKATLREWLHSAKGVVIFPNVHKAAFVVGGRGGRGVFLVKRSGGDFGSPAFFSLGGGSVGLQVGYERSSIMLLLMNDKTVRSALNGGFELGAGASVAVGTITDSNQAAEGVAGADVISVVLDNSGAFLGASVNGAVLRPNVRLNQLHYGSSDVQAISETDRFTRSHRSPLASTLKRMEGQ